MQKKYLIKFNTHHDKTTFSKERIEMIFLTLLEYIT